MNAPSRRILIVDDDEHVCSALRRTLRREGFQLFLANNPHQAIELLKTTQVDLVLSDHLMPEMTGLELLQLVRERYPDVVRIMLTGHADLKTAITAIGQGLLYRFLTKPWDDSELKVTLALAFEQLDLKHENARLLSVVRHQQELLAKLERRYPAIGALVREVEPTRPH